MFARNLLLSLLIIFLCENLTPADAGIIKKIKDSVSSIKKFFIHDHGPNEHCGNSEEIEDNRIDATTETLTSTSTVSSTTSTSTSTSSSTEFPQLDLRWLTDENGTIAVPDLNSRTLIDPGRNECPVGYKLDRTNKCRKEI